MGKYKNDFMVIGSKSLTNAFTEELKSLGYENLGGNYGDNLGVFGYNGPDSKSCYSYYSVDFVAGSQLQYYLPQQWNEALAAASELYVEERIIKDGDWIKWGDGNLYRLEHKYGNLFDMIIWKEEAVKCTNYSTTTIKEMSIPATSEEIKEWLVKWFKKEYKFKIGDYIVGLREVSSSDNLDNIRFLADKNFSGRVRLGSQFFYNQKTDTLYNTGMNDISVVYERGEWIKKKSLPTLHSYPGVVEKDVIKYGCKSIHKATLLRLFDDIEFFNNDNKVKISAVAFDGYVVSPNEIQEILKNA